MTDSYKMGKHTGMKIKTNIDNQEKIFAFWQCIYMPAVFLFLALKLTAYLEK